MTFMNIELKRDRTRNFITCVQYSLVAT